MMKFNDDELRLIEMVINEPGFRMIENYIVSEMDGFNDLGRITGNAFDDGKLLGRVEGMGLILFGIQSIRQEIKGLKKA